MKPDEIKIRLCSYINGLVDDIFPGNELFDRLKSATAKFWVEQNVWKLDSILNQFKDAYGNIDMVAAEKIYGETMFDEDGKLRINLRTIIPNETVSRYFPDSTVLLTKDDIHSIFSNHEQETIINSSTK